MFPQSIRWRLPLSFAGIALLAALVLGVVLLTTLRGYYAVHELEHLSDNAGAIGDMIAQMYTDNISLAQIAIQVEGLSFLAQSRVRLLDVDGNLLADSGELQQDRFIALGYGDYLNGYTSAGDEATIQYIRPDSATIVSSPVTTVGFILLQSKPSDTVQEVVANDLPPDTFMVSVAGTPYGFGLNADLSPGRRSDQHARTPIYDSQTGGSGPGRTDLGNRPALRLAGRAGRPVVPCGTAERATAWQSKRLSAILTVCRESFLRFLDSNQTRYACQG